MKNPILVLCMIIVLGSLAAFGEITMQMAGATVIMGPDGKIASCRVTIRPPTNSAAFVTGAPYSATEISEQTQILADGNRVVQETPSCNIYRDSAGRIRTDRPAIMTPNVKAVESMPIIPEIYDPVSGDQYFLDTGNRVAHHFKIPEELRSRPINVSAISRPPGEALGTRMIDGILAEGARQTTTIPVGSRGNDKPVVSTTEMWQSLEIKVQILMRRIDPFSGEYLRALVNIRRAEPDAKLFRIPADYKVVDETGTFTLTATNSK